MEKLSVLIITYNEIHNIKKCINSVLFADEIIVVDSFSTDGTFEWLNNHPKVNVIQHPFKNYTDQKTFTLEQASYNWIYFLDADEVVPPLLKEEIIQTINNKTACSAYYNYRAFMFKNKRLYFSGWQTDKIHRLFKKDKCKFVTNRIVHETLQVEGNTCKLKHKLIHYCYKNYIEYKQKMIKYGQMRAIEAHQKNKKWTLAHQYLRPVWKFFNHFIIRLGFLDGKKGLIISYLNALGVWERYKKLKKLYNY